MVKRKPKTLKKIKGKNLNIIAKILKEFLPWIKTLLYLCPHPKKRKILKGNQKKKKLQKIQKKMILIS